MANLRIEFFQGQVGIARGRDPIGGVTLAVTGVATSGGARPVVPAATQSNALIFAIFEADAPVYVDAGPAPDPTIAAQATLVYPGTPVEIVVQAGNLISAVNAADIVVTTGGGTLAAGENFIGIVGGKSAVVGGTFTTPAGVTAYSIGDLIANSATAGSVVPITVAAARAADKTGMVRRARVKTVDTGAAGATVRVHLYKDDPSASSGITNGDNGVWLTKEANYIGAFDVILDKHFSDQEKGVGAPLIGSELNFDPSSGTANIFALLEARTAFTPQGAKVWSLALEVLQN